MIDIIEVAIKYRYNTAIKHTDVIDIGIKYNYNRYNRYKIQI